MGGFYNRPMKALLALLLLLPTAALAQLIEEDYKLLGVAVRTRPAYDGSLSQRTDLVPIVRYYGQPLFARTTQGILEGGLRWDLGSGLAAGLQLSYDEGRDTSESAFLRDHNFTDDTDPGASYGAHLEWDTKIGPAPFGVLFRYRQSFDSDRGSLADLRFNLGRVRQARRHRWSCSPKRRGAAARRTAPSTASRRSNRLPPASPPTSRAAACGTSRSA